MNAQKVKELILEMRKRQLGGGVIKLEEFDHFVTVLYSFIGDDEKVVALTSKQAKVLADWVKASLTGYDPYFDAAFDVAYDVCKQLDGWVSCSPGCPGVAVFDANFAWPEGYVHIERCDECNRFENDDDAAEFLVGESVFYICLDCDDVARRVLTREEAERHVHFIDVADVNRVKAPRLRLLIKKEDADKAVRVGKLIEWRE